MHASVTFGRILGIPSGAHFSWFLVFALVTWSLAAGYFPREYRGWSAGAYWLVAVVTGALLFASVLVHELRRHGWRARRRLAGWRRVRCR